MPATSSRPNARRRALALGLSLGVLLTACNGAGNAGGDHEAQVLQIIRDNPAVIVESVQAYQQQREAEQSQAQNEAAAKLLANREAAVGSSPQKGAENSEILLIEFSDFECPFCAQVQPVINEFLEKNGDRVTLVYKHTPLVQIHPQAVPAALASWAAMQQGKFWEYHDALFENQEGLSEEVYLEIAEELGLDLEQFQADVASDGATQALQEDITLASQLGISGTPTFFLNGERLTGGLSIESLEAALVEAESAQ